MVKWLPVQRLQAVPSVDCSSMCNLYLFSVFFYPPPLILNVILETVVSGLALLGVCALGNICSGSENFQTAWMPWCEGIGNRGTCPASPGRMMMGIWGNAWSPPAAADLAHPHFSLCGFSPTALYQHLILVGVPFFPLPACIASPFLRQEVRGAKPDRWEKSLVSESPLLFSPGRAGCYITCHMQTCLGFISA